MSGTSLQPPASPWIGNDRKYITVKMTIQRPSLLTAIAVRMATSPEEGTILLRQSPCGAFTDAMPLHFSIGHPAHGQQTLHYVSVMHPCINNGYSVKLSLMLDAKAPLYVEQAVMDVVEL